MAVVLEQLALQRKLDETFSEARSRNPRFTLRAFSRKLGINHSALSEILRGKRRVSSKLARRLLERSGASAGEMEAILKLFNETLPADSQTWSQSSRYLQVAPDAFPAEEQWFYFGVLAFAETSDFRDDPDLIAKRFNVSRAQAFHALQRLKDMGCLVADSITGVVRSAGKRLMTTDGTNNEHLRQAHLKNVELAGHALQSVERQERDFTSLTLAMDPEQLPLARKLIREFEEHFEAMLDTRGKREVYKICVQLFPLTRERSDS